MVDGHDVSIGLLQRQQHVACLLTSIGYSQEAREVPVRIWTGEDIHQLLSLQKLHLQPLCHAA